MTSPSQLLTQEVSPPTLCVYIASVPEEKQCSIHIMFCRFHVISLPMWSPVTRITYTIATQTTLSLFMSRLNGTIWRSRECLQRRGGWEICSLMVENNDCQKNGLIAEQSSEVFFLLSVLVVNHRVAEKAFTFCTDNMLWLCAQLIFRRYLAAKENIAAFPWTVE